MERGSVEPNRIVEVSNEEIDWLKLCDSLEELALRKREEGRGRAPEGEEFEQLMAEGIREAVRGARRREENTPD